MKRVLIVDDDPENRELLVVALDTLNRYELYEASTGQDARAMLARQPFHLVLLTRELPDMDGLELAHEIRQSLLQTVIVMLSVDDTTKAFAQAYAVGANAYVLKPYDLLTVLTLIRQLETMPIQSHTKMLTLRSNAKYIGRFSTSPRSSQAPAVAGSSA